MIAPERVTVHGRLKNSRVFAEKGLRPGSFAGRPQNGWLVEVAWHLGSPGSRAALPCVLWGRFWGQTRELLVPAPQEPNPKPRLRVKSRQSCGRVAEPSPLSSLPPDLREAVQIRYAEGPISSLLWASGVSEPRVLGTIVLSLGQGGRCEGRASGPAEPRACSVALWSGLVSRLHPPLCVAPVGRHPNVPERRLLSPCEALVALACPPGTDRGLSGGPAP